MTNTVEYTNTMNTAWSSGNRNNGYTDAGKNEMVIYKKRRLGRTIVTTLWIIIGLGVFLSLTSLFLFARSIKMSKDTITKCNELVAILTSDDTTAEDNGSGTTSNGEKVKKKDSWFSRFENVSTDTDLAALKMVASEGASVENNCQNTVGNTFVRAIIGQGYYDTHVTYYLNNTYSRLMADVSVLDNSWVEEVPYTFEIFADNDENKVLYSTTLARVSSMQHIDIDVSDVEFLTFRASYPGCTQYPTFVLSDAVLTTD